MTGDRIRQRLAEALAWIDEVQVALPGDAIDRAAAALEQTVRALIAEAEQRGRDSVGLGDFLPDPCGEEERAPDWHFAETYGDWLDCTLRRGHNGDEHEHGPSGFTWPVAAAAFRARTEETT
ncbi:hypothetical protein [Geodermatophilus chilensis]|uniref:hypothetical protein n=1 Tax=Geodermatophilus chilensis TaxID=2035835 RepID=UPI000C2595EA|nr:hypothetical protein [Geodermatophilus chilensis]